MKSDLPPLDALVVFETVARRLSFARAAEELFLTPSAVSHQIAKLEQFLGFLLFERLSKGIALSKAGEDYLKRVAAALGAIGSATNDIRKGVKNSLNVHASTSIASLWLMPRLGAFVRAHRDIALSLSASPVNSDFALGQVDVDIRYGVPDWPNLVVEPIFEENILPLASPDLLMREPVHSPTDLLERPLIQSTVSVVQWRDWFSSRGIDTVPERFAFRFDRAAMSLEAAVQGFGIALESQKIAAQHIANGQLLPVFHADWGIRVHAHFVVYPERNAQRQEVAQFLVWLREQAEQSL
ncbi:LysR substrate-binding domain-containing protein [Propionivibrio dicarboxylicus]|uniref:LysR family transcriptional regulator, glycine cleavage system transcriptional activator n=1 Tax=Propionivibrio dicarboxylicus TaxID=83767 RepID=A0A1G8JUR2_9RHOO|nr:LysR substrate-binding domain-containing protein [Propionivibrio dicarboxylicus]SDI34962.1 LysR family transcriptional regulator, glycine cleavage system transcriptional activator [Propionivibrio dicarboxylicus]